jgi:hypothetical protein
MSGWTAYRKVPLQAGRVAAAACNGTVDAHEIAIRDFVNKTESLNCQ